MNETRTPLPHTLCDHLCSKKLYMINDGRTLALEDLQTAGYENYWCRHTMTDTAQDGGWVTYERCGPERGCYQASATGASPGSRILGQG
jgi:hypothetical protein